jgi:RNA polymerase sigma factor (TIGR02999 family)
MGELDSAGRSPGSPQAARAGDRQALDAMLPEVYTELRALAARYLRRESEGHTLQPTALVHEAFLRLVDQRKVDWTNRAQLLGIAAEMMRRILVNYARDRTAAKRGGGGRRVSLSVVEDSLRQADVDMLMLHDALQKLEQIDQRKGRVVELKYFGGLTTDEIAEVLGISGATVEREWKFARAWLYDAMSGGGGGPNDARAE